VMLPCSWNHSEWSFSLRLLRPCASAHEGVPNRRDVKNVCLLQLVRDISPGGLAEVMVAWVKEEVEVFFCSDGQPSTHPWIWSLLWSEEVNSY